MKDNNKSIFNSHKAEKKDKNDVKKIKSISYNSGYLHDWKQERNKKRNGILIKLAVFAAVFAVAVSVTIFINVHKLNKIKEERAEFLAQITPAPTQKIEKATEEPVEHSEELSRALVQYEDVIGYLKIEDTNIDFPIVQGEDNFFFENRNYDRSYSEIAATYLLAECDPSTSRHIIIYGENSELEGRLGDLNEYLDNDFFTNHEYIIFELENGKKLWQVFSVHLAGTSFDYKDVYFESNTEYLAYIKMFQTMSRFERNITLTEKDRVLTIVTDYQDLDLDEGYLMIHARLIN